MRTVTRFPEHESGGLGRSGRRWRPATRHYRLGRQTEPLETFASWVGGRWWPLPGCLLGAAGRALIRCAPCPASVSGSGRRARPSPQPSTCLFAATPLVGPRNTPYSFVRLGQVYGFLSVSSGAPCVCVGRAPGYVPGGVAVRVLRSLVGCPRRRPGRMRPVPPALGSLRCDPGSRPPPRRRASR